MAMTYKILTFLKNPTISRKIYTMHAELSKCSISKCSQEMKKHNIASWSTMELKAKETFTRGAEQNSN